MNNTKICRLCLKACTENFLQIQEITKDILEVLLINMDLDISENPVKCKECIENLEECFEFKSVCISTEEQVIAVLEWKRLRKTNMKQVYLKTAKNNHTLSKMKEVCRFCIKPLTKFFTIDQLNKDFSVMVQRILPEVKLHVTNNPVSCSNCLNSLKNYFTFLKDCLDIEQCIKAYCKVKNITGKVELNNLVQYRLKHTIGETVTENSITTLNEDIDEVTFNEKQPVKTHFSDPADLETVTTENQLFDTSSDSGDTETNTTEEQPVEVYSSDSVIVKTISNNPWPGEAYSSCPDKTELVIKEEQLIQKKFEDHADMNILTTEERLTETYSSDPSDTKESRIRQRNTRGLLLEETRNENYSDNDDDDDEDDIFLEVCKEENNIENIDIAECKIDIDEVNNINIKRESSEEVEEETSSITDVREDGATGINTNMQELVFRLTPENFNRKEEDPKRLTETEKCLKEYQEVHGKKGKFKCPKCKKDFTKKLYMDDHILKQHDNLFYLITSKIHSCNICNYKTCDKTKLSEHMNIKQLQWEKYHCYHCSRGFLKKDLLGNHISRVHLKLRPFICTDCKKAFALKIYLDSHIVSRHQKNLDLMKTVSSKIHYCDHCSYKSIIKPMMTRHMKTHTVNVEFKCPECKKTFKRRCDMDDHIVKYHDNLISLLTSKIHSCNICNYKTCIKKKLSQHIIIRHPKSKRYHCYHCSRGFFQKFVLRKHISTVHLNLRPFICIGCKKTFGFKTKLDAHILSKHQKNVDLMETVTSKMYYCYHCVYKSVDKTKMTKHMKTHTV